MVEVRTRSDRRSEKKQSFVFIAFILTIAIVFFASGYMVGRNSAQEETVDLTASEAKKVPAKKKIEKEAPEKKADELTFYESLPKGEQPPLGSGINLPVEKPTAKAATATNEEVKKPIPEKVFQPTKTESVETKAAPVQTASRPKADPETVAYILQVASFPQPDEAGKLLGKLTQGGYDVYVQQADLGSKGVWYRVFVGPVTGESKVSYLKAKIEKEFKVKPIVRKR
ncbi:MAG: hypothetical protein C0623_06050 [Desulfuromonas sp.]|nr:MAG: hypothetical protein C0623_06050 [Desulfuromonas sp.]